VGEISRVVAERGFLVPISVELVSFIIALSIVFFILLKSDSFGGSSVVLFIWDFMMGPGINSFRPPAWLDGFVQPLITVFFVFMFRLPLPFHGSLLGCSFILVVIFVFCILSNSDRCGGSLFI